MLWRVIEQLEKKRINFSELERVACEVDPTLTERTGLRQYLLRELKDLEAEGKIRLPKNRKGWTSGHMPLPVWLQKVTPEAEKPKQDLEYARISWHPLMHFAADLTHPKSKAHAQAINQFLIEGRKPEVSVPLRELSFRIFKDEKKLDQMVNNDTLFQGRLNIADLNGFQPLIPLAYLAPDRRVSGPLLVVENQHTFDSLARLNDELRIYAGIVYGQGNQGNRAFGESLDRLMKRLEADSLVYYGDIDNRGIEIPAEANRDRIQRGLAPLQPAETLYFALLTSGSTAPAIEAGRLSSSGKQWLGKTLSSGVLRMFQDGLRIPQEALDYPAMKRLLST